jgi:hypothetical protein
MTSSEMNPRRVTGCREVKMRFTGIEVNGPQSQNVGQMIFLDTKVIQDLELS